MASCRSHAENLSCAVSNRGWSRNLVCVSSVNWKKMMKKFRVLKVRKLKFKSERFSVRYEESGRAKERRAKERRTKERRTKERGAASTTNWTARSESSWNNW